MTDRAVRALEDVVAVEEVAPGLSRVVTFSDAYYIDARGEGCNCPDQRHNLGPDEPCKHQLAAMLADYDHLPSPYVTSVESRPTELDADNDGCEDCAALPDVWACSDCAINGDAEIEV